MSVGTVNQILDYLADGDVRTNYHSTNSNIGDVAASDIKTLNLDISSVPAKNRIIAGFAIGSNNRLAIAQCYCSSENTIVVRVVNVSTSVQRGGNITIFYC